MAEEWVFFESTRGDQWFWRLVDCDTGRVVELSRCGFPTLKECIKNAQVHGYGGSVTYSKAA